MIRREVPRAAALAPPVAAPPASRAARARLGIPFEELEQRATLGAGTYGRVRLAYHRATDRVFALKMLRKADIVAHGQQLHVRRERDVLMALDHPFIIKLYDTYSVRLNVED